MDPHVSTPIRLLAEPAVRETWQVCNQLGGPRATAIASSEQAKHMRLIPWAGVAARLSTTAHPELAADGNGKERPSLVRGAAYCFLPLPVVTGLPVHVNGYFELSSNRRVHTVQLSAAIVCFMLLSELLVLEAFF